MEPRYTLRSRPVTGSGSIARAAAAHGSTPTARMVVEQGHDDHGNYLNNEHTPVHTKRIDNVAPQPMNQPGRAAFGARHAPAHASQRGARDTPARQLDAARLSPARPDNILLANKTPASSSGKTAHPRRNAQAETLIEPLARALPGMSSKARVDH